MKKLKIKHSSRKWLNADKTKTAFIATELAVEGEGKNSWSWVTLTLKDCTRSATLDMAVSTKAERKRAFKKMDILIEELTNLRKEMVSACKKIDKEKKCKK